MSCWITKKFEKNVAQWAERSGESPKADDNYCIGDHAGKQLQETNHITKCVQNDRLNYIIEKMNNTLISLHDFVKKQALSALSESLKKVTSKLSGD